MVPTMKVAVLASLTAALTSAQFACALTSLSDWNDGIATFYGGQPDGASDGLISRTVLTWCLFVGCMPIQ